MITQTSPGLQIKTNFICGTNCKHTQKVFDNQKKRKRIIKIYNKLKQGTTK